MRSRHGGAWRWMTSAALVAGVVVSGTPRPAAACGPDFPVELLSHRDEVMLGLHDGVFAVEATQLLGTPAAPAAVPASSSEPAGAEETARYARGARLFEAHDLEGAERAFRAVLALPPVERRRLSIKATYMLGRTADGAPAIAAYRRVRELAAAGFADDDGLAVSSLGQEARLHREAGELVQAVRLYAEQAAAGDAGAVASLLIVVRGAIRDHAETTLLADPVGQRLVSAYLFTRAAELEPADLERLWAGLDAHPQLVGSDRLAAAAYHAARWDLAGRLAARAPDQPLSRWVRAKLALRAGDRAGARQLLEAAEADLARAEAACTRETADFAVDQLGLDRIRGELATLALAEGRMVDAMKLAWSARVRYPLDALHIAERVLTIDELRAFVDQLDTDGAPAVVDGQGGETTFSLRDVLAHRYVRAGQLALAIPYFAGVPRADAIVLRGALDRAAHAADPIERARADYDAAVVTRAHGLEVRGTLHAPDWGVVSAAYDLSTYDITGGWPSVDPAPWVGGAERARISQAAPAPLARYHYRGIASELAERAADAVPPRSQAFAALLCHAARYARSVDPARADALWERYAREGAAVEFSGTFGAQCPEPDFEGARTYYARHPPRLVLRGISRRMLALLVGLCALALGAYGLVRPDRRGL